MIDAFAIGVRLTFASNGAQVLNELIRHLTGVHAGVHRINAEWERTKPLMLGALAVAAGAGALAGIWKIIDTTQELNKQLQKTKELGGEFEARLPEERAAAFRTQQEVPTSNFAENVKMLRELQTQLGSFEAAQAVLSPAARFAQVLEHYTGTHSDDTVQKAIKVAELRGQIFSVGPDGQEHVDPTKLMAELDAMSRGIRISGGLLKLDDFLAMAKQAGLAAKGMDPTVFYGMMGELAVSMGAGRTGTAMTGFFQQMVGGTMSRHVAEEMEKVGLLRPGEWKSDHGQVVVGDEATKRLSAIQADPFKYINETLVPQLEKDGKTGKDLLMEVFKLFGRQTVERLVGEIMQNKPQFERAMKMFPEVKGADDAFKQLQAEDLSTNIKALGESWRSFMQALGDAGVPLAIKILHLMTDVVQFLGRTAETYPHVAEWLMATAAGIAAIAAIGGGLRVIAFGFGALAGPIRALEALPFGAAAVGLTKLAGAIGLAAGAAATAETILAHKGALEDVDKKVPWMGALDDWVYRHTGIPWFNRHDGANGDPRVPAPPGGAAVPGPPNNMTVRPEKQSWNADPAAEDRMAHKVAAALGDRIAAMVLSVQVTNAGDVGRAAGGGAMTQLARVATRPPTTATGGDIRAAQSYPSRLAFA